MAYTTINKSGDYFNTKLYTGTGSSNAVTGVGFQPDWIWIKNRVRAEDHAIFDAVRGASGGYYGKIRSNTTSAQEYDGNGMSAIGSDGFTVLDQDQVNRSGDTYASWNWKANGAGSSNSDGSITSTVSVNTTAGFSIVKYTGTGANATVGHGLGVAPSMIIVKKYNVTGSWGVYHNSLGNGNFLYLNDTNASASNSTLWNNTSPTSSVFNLGSSAISNSSSNSHIAYCFAEKQGYSKFGSYTGNGNADGSFIYTGFKPAFYIIKRTSDTFSWIIKDTKRPGYNVNGTYLVANTTIAEATGSGNLATDEYSNGFKIRGTSDALNGSGQPYIYMAFGQSIVGSNNIPATAR